MKGPSPGREETDRGSRKRRRKASRSTREKIERDSSLPPGVETAVGPSAEVGGVADLDAFFPASERGVVLPEPLEELPAGLLPRGPGGYEVIRRIASGGMAELLLARRRGLAGTRQEVVIKRLFDEAIRDHDIARMFLWEAWISSRLAHPNIVRFFDLFQHRGRYHIVFEHVAGRDVAALAREARNEGRLLPLDAVLDIGIGAARGLDHAHRLEDDQGRSVGLIHRDVSPHNLLVSRDGEVKIADFGVAKTLSTHVPRQTTVGLVKGKMAYVAPEQLRGEPIDARSDLFSLGVVLFELCTGTRLFSRSTDLETLRAVREAVVPAMSPLRPDCPAALEAIVRRALERDPAARFASAAEMADVLAEVRAAVPGPGARALLALAAAPQPPRDGASRATGLADGTSDAAPAAAVLSRADAGEHPSYGPPPAAASPEAASSGEAAARARDNPLAATLRERRAARPTPPTCDELTSPSERDAGQDEADEAQASAPVPSQAFPLVTPRGPASSLRTVVTLTVAFLVGAAATAVGSQAAERLFDGAPASPLPAHVEPAAPLPPSR